MSRFPAALLLVVPMVAACLDGAPLDPVDQGPRKPGAPGLSLHERVRNAKRAGPGVVSSVNAHAALDLEAALPELPSTLTIDDSWRNRGGGTVDAIGGAQKWAKTLGAPGWDSVQQVVRYDSDEVLVIGWIGGLVDFGPLCGEVKPGERDRTTNFSYSSYVARFNDAGVCQWIDTFDSDDAWPVAVAVDAAFNVWVVGMFNSEVRFGPGLDLVTAGNAYDVFIARYDDKGALGWTQSISGPSDTWAYDVALVEDGNGADAVVVGAFDATAVIGGTTLTSAGDYDMLAVRYTDAGAVSFASAFGGEGDDELYSVVAVGSNVVAGGFFSSPTLSLGGAGTLSSVGGYDAVLVGLGGGGGASWANAFGGDGDDYVYDMAPASGAVAVVGSFSGTMSVGGLPEITSAGTSMYVAKFGATGGGQWSYGISSANGVAYATSVRANASGDIYVAGVIDGDTAFGSTMLSPAAGSWSIVTARYGAAGGETPLWAAQMDGAGSVAFPVLDVTNKYLMLSADLTANGGDMALYGLGL